MSTTAVAPVIPLLPEPPRPRLRLVPPPLEAQGPTAAPEVRVVIAASQALLRAGYRALLESAAGISIAGEAATADEAVTLARFSEADVLLLENDLPGADPMDSIREVAELPGTKVIVLTHGDAAESAFAALRAGASGFLLMDCEPDELVAAVRAVAGGGGALSPSITRGLITRLALQPDLGDARDGLEELTDREREVMALAARGLSNVEIGEGLGVSPATAKTHINRAMMKLRARDRAQLVAFAYESGLVTPPREELQLVP